MNNLENTFGIQIQPNLQMKEIKIEVDKEWFNVKKCLENPTKLYIFGDNLMRVGKGGQAQIRDCFNATGIATKCAPTMESNAFFRDGTPEEQEYFKNVIQKDILKIRQRLNNPNFKFDTIVFPIDGIGTGLSELPKWAPIIWTYLKETLHKEFSLHTNKFGNLSYMKENLAPYGYDKVEN